MDTKLSTGNAEFLIMRKLLLVLIIASSIRAFSQACIPPGGSGIGCDVPTAVVCTPSGSDASKATCTWTTTQSSDSMVTTIDNGNNPGPTFYNPAMVTSHTVNVTNLQFSPPPPAASVKIKYMVSSCTHVTSGGIGTQCPDSSPDWSSTGPPTRMPGAPPTFATIPLPSGPLSSWWTIAQAPQNVFPGQEFYIMMKQGPGIGVFGTTNSNTNNIRFLLFHDVSIDAPGPVTNQCGAANTAGTGGNANPISPTYRFYGDSTFSIPCLGGSPNSDFILEPVPSTNWAQGNPNGNATPGIVAGAATTMINAGQAGYFINSWTGGDFSVYVKVGASVAPGNYVIHYQLQPLDWNGCGNGTGGTSGCASSSLLSQNKTIDVPITVITPTPLASHPPASFPPWAFQQQFMAMAAYWTTWACSNTTDFRSGGGPMALMYNSGVSEAVNFSPGTSSIWPWVYDGGSNYLGTGDLLYATAHPGWLASHTYTIGDLITVTVSGKPTTFVMNLVGGLANPTLTGVSGSSPPVFNPAPSKTTADATLQWMSVGDADYYRGCALNATDGFRNNFLMTQTTNAPEYTYQPAGMLMSLFRTGDASPGDYTGFSYTDTTTAKFSNLKGINNQYVSPAACNGISETVGTGYWQGGTRLTLCYLTSILSQLGPAVNGNNLSTGRQKGFMLNSSVAYWSLTNDPTWINGNNPTDDGGARTKRMVETNLAFLDMYMTIPSSKLAEATSANLNVLGGYFMSGAVAESLINYYMQTVYYSDTTKFPCNPATGYTTGYLGPCVTPDERIPQAIKIYADRTWVNEFDIEYDKNQVVADACTPAPPCQSVARRLHSYTTRYNRWTFPDFLYSYTFWTEAGSNGEYGFTWAWLWERDSTMVPPSNGRITVSSYRDIALTMWQHSYDGRDCPAVSGTTPGTCRSWGVADYVNGGRSTGSAGYNNLVNNSKTVQQTIYQTMREGLHWALGDWSATQGALQLATNPCWIVANRAADGSCNTPSPFTDVQAPYTMNFYFNNGRPGAIIPTICRPGAVSANALTSICNQVNPTQNVPPASPPGNGFGSSQVPMNGGRSTLSNTFATFNFMTVKAATCQLVVDTPAVEPTHVNGVNTFPESPAHTPILAGGTPLPLWFHTITAAPLNPTTNYHFGVYCTDDGTLPPDPATCSANPAHCFNLPYQIGGTTGKFAISYGTQDQAGTLTTTALPTGADLVVQPGVTVNRGVTVK